MALAITDWVYKWDMFLPPLGSKSVHPVTTTQKQLWHNIHKRCRVLWPLSLTEWKPFISAMSTSYRLKRKENYFSLGLVTMHFWHHPVGMWEGFTNQRNKEIFNMQHESLKLDFSHTHTHKNISICLKFLQKLKRTFKRITPPGMATIIITNWVSRAETRGRKQLMVICLFAAWCQQRIKATECKQTSQGWAKESIRRERQGSERQINVQTSQPLQQWKKTQLCSSERTSCVFIILHCQGCKTFSIHYILCVCGYNLRCMWSMNVSYCSSVCALSSSFKQEEKPFSLDFIFQNFMLLQMELSCSSLKPLLSSLLMQTPQFLLQSNCCCVFRSTNIKAFIRLNHFCAVLIAERDRSNWRLLVFKGWGLSQLDGIDGCGLYHYLDVSAMCMQYRVLKSKMNPGNSNNPSIISHSAKPV